MSHAGGDSTMGGASSTEVGDETLPEDVDSGIDASSFFHNSHDKAGKPVWFIGTTSILDEKHNGVTTASTKGTPLVNVSQHNRNEMFTTLFVTEQVCHLFPVCLYRLVVSKSQRNLSVTADNAGIPISCDSCTL